MTIEPPTPTTIEPIIPPECSLLLNQFIAQTAGVFFRARRLYSHDAVVCVQAQLT
jgi:hypothetical protein